MAPVLVEDVLFAAEHHRGCVRARRAGTKVAQSVTTRRSVVAIRNSAPLVGADSWIHKIKDDGYRLLASVQCGNMAVSAIWRCLDQETAVDR